MKYFSQLADNKNAWGLLALGALVLELTALYFQYGMGLEPCIMCVYQRVAIFAILIAGVIGYFGNENIVGRLAAYSLWGVGAIWGLLIAIEHVDMQANAGSLFYTCDFIPNFPSWAPLHEWLPALFEASGDCGEISWQFLGYSMPQWMIVNYAVFSLLFIVILLSRIIDKKSI